MNKTQAFKVLSQINQEHLLVFFDQLPPKQQQKLLFQIEKLSFPLFKEQQRVLPVTTSSPQESIEPFNEASFFENEKWKKRGLEIIQEGKVGCLLLAGGQGTRLGFKGPKGCFPVSLIKKKTLFQIFAEKVKAAGLQAKRTLFLAIMTSPQNHEETVQFFQKNALFGLKQEQLFFFQQGELPFLDNEGKLFLEDEGTIAFGPDGNGMALHHFVKKGLWEVWKDQGIHHLNTVLIDNPLADPFDPYLIGFQEETSLEIAIKSTKRLDSQEKVGVIVKKGNKTGVIEYSELPKNKQEALDSHGELLFFLANLSLFSFDMDFIKRVTSQQMPLHKAYKATKKQNKDIHAWKFETFIFDLLPFANSAQPLIYPRERCFAPLKNREGKDSLSSVQEALLARDKTLFEEVSQTEIASGRVFELSQDFYYPTQELINNWKGKQLPQKDYVEAYI